MKACGLGHVFGSLPERLIRFTTAGGELSIWTVWVDHGYIPCTRRTEKANSVLQRSTCPCSGKILLDTSKIPSQERAFVQASSESIARPAVLALLCFAPSRKRRAHSAASSSPKKTQPNGAKRDVGAKRGPILDVWYEKCLVLFAYLLHDNTKGNKIICGCMCVCECASRGRLSASHHTPGLPHDPITI